MDRWEFLQDSGGSWWWRYSSADGNVVLISAEAYPSRAQAVADAISNGFVGNAPERDFEIAPVAHQVGAPDLESLKLEYTRAFSTYENLIAALSQTASITSNDLREDVARALRALDRVRGEYRAALLQTAVDGGSLEG